ncbi:MAG: Rrf2 family transcriptional regulator [Pirellulaceae bacterium]|nr:Rrf2 family transcriptional regulator [Pirellulaceae bacterium]
MNISAKAQYACLAVLELAAHFGSAEPVQVGVIADRHGIPARFLVQILLQLKAAGYVASTRGTAGGYHLRQDPARLTLADIMSVVERPAAELTPGALRDTPMSRALLAAWNDVLRTEREQLEAITFADLLERTQAAEPMYFI